jgi:putative effector of murein hydrolase LrgA (UPF0299 family)
MPLNKILQFLNSGGRILRLVFFPVAVGICGSWDMLKAIVVHARVSDMVHQLQQLTDDCVEPKD